MFTLIDLLIACVIAAPITVALMKIFKKKREYVMEYIGFIEEDGSTFCVFADDEQEVSIFIEDDQLKIAVKKIMEARANV